jgi:hypothetical protein
VIRGCLIRVVNVVVVDDLDDVRQGDGNASVKELDISFNTKKNVFAKIGLTLNATNLLNFLKNLCD